MFKKMLFLFAAILVLASTGYAKEVADVDMPDNILVGNDVLVLNGAGVRTKLFVKAYVGGLYLKQKSGDATAIIDADETMSVKLQITSKMISGKKMEQATREGFSNSTNGNTAPYKDKIDTFVSTFKDNIKPGDVYDIIYTPAEGTKVYKNKELKCTVQGLDFKKVLFGIWLGVKPADKDLKAGMLGK
ncbi:MAG TPA: chalcone isomerase family protein [Smithella sp.]|nr:chalcone isomerase family protein [Smithella sp.]